MCMHRALHTDTHPYLSRHSKWGHTIHMCVLCVRPGIQSEDKSVYNTFKVRTFFHTPLNMPGTYKERITSIPPTPILWKSEDSAPSHKARTKILTSLCQNVLTLNVKNWFWSSLWMPGRKHILLYLHVFKVKIWLNVDCLLHMVLTQIEVGSGTDL